MLALFFSIVCRFGFFPNPLRSSEAAMKRRLSEAGFPSIGAGSYLSGSLLLSSAASFALSAPSLLFLTLQDSAALLLFSFALFLYAFFSLPALAALRRRMRIESDLPFLLRELAVYLDIGIPFEKALFRIGQRNYSLSEEFARACKEVRSGSTVQGALMGISAGTGSIPLKRCLLLLSSIYETGAGSEPLKRTAEELSSSQLSAMRSSSSRLSLLAILFITSSALIPAFFAVYLSVAPLLSAAPLPAWQIYTAFLLVFPTLNTGALALMFFLLPPVPSFSADQSALLEDFLRKAGFPSRNAFIVAIAAVSLASSLALFLLGFPSLAALSLLLAPIAYFLAQYLASQQIREAEGYLPDALYSAASTHRLLSAERMLSLLSRGGFGRLSEAFGLAERRQKSGDSFPSSLAAALAHCPSPLVERAIYLLVASYETGANMYSALREAATDVVSFFSLVQERAALLSIQRYTVLAASAFLVPVILGTVLSLVPALSASSGVLGPSQPPSAESLASACQAYLLINSLLSSVALAMAETSPKKAALYFALCAPASQFFFLLASSGAVSAFLS